MILKQPSDIQPLLELFTLCAETESLASASAVGLDTDTSTLVCVVTVQQTAKLW